MVRINNLCGNIKRFEEGSAVIRLKGFEKDTRIPVSMLKAPKGFEKLSFRKMKSIINQKNLGYKKGQKVCITNEFPLFDN